MADNKFIKLFNNFQEAQLKQLREHGPTLFPVLSYQRYLKRREKVRSSG